MDPALPWPAVNNALTTIQWMIVSRYEDDRSCAPRLFKIIASFFFFFSFFLFFFWKLQEQSCNGYNNWSMVRETDVARSSLTYLYARDTVTRTKSARKKKWHSSRENRWYFSRLKLFFGDGGPIFLQPHATASFRTLNRALFSWRWGKSVHRS